MIPLKRQCPTRYIENKKKEFYINVVFLYTSTFLPHDLSFRCCLISRSAMSTWLALSSKVAFFSSTSDTTISSPRTRYNFSFHSRYPLFIQMIFPYANDCHSDVIALLLPYFQSHFSYPACYWRLKCQYYQNQSDIRQVCCYLNMCNIFVILTES